jgi:hypothetical protein
MPNGLIALIVLVLAMLLLGGFLIVRLGPPKDARRRQVKAADGRARRARLALHDVKQILLAEQESSLDLVGLDLRRRSLDVISRYENKELEIEDV